MLELENKKGYKLIFSASTLKNRKKSKLNTKNA